MLWQASMTSTRPALRWLLLGTVVAVGITQCKSKGDEAFIVQAVSQATSAPSTSSRAQAHGSESTRAPLPVHLTGLSLHGQSRSDPFQGGGPEAKQAPSPSLPSPASNAGNVPEPPQAAAPDYSYLGRLTDPDGKERVFLRRAEKPIEAALGTVLDDGYAVEAVEKESVRLRHSATGLELLIALPPDTYRDYR